MSRRKYTSRAKKPKQLQVIADDDSTDGLLPSEAALTAFMRKPPKGAEESLREKILDFIYQPRFERDAERALGLYFGPAAMRRRMIVAEEEEIPDFQEWYVNDFVTGEGKRLIDCFAEDVGPTLPPAEAKLLAAWRMLDRLRLFEIQSVEPGVGVVVRDLLNDEELTIHDRSSSRALRRWMILLARPHQAEDRVCFTGSGIPLSPMEKEDVLEFAQGLWNSYRLRRPDASLPDFYREHSLDLIREMKRLREEAGRPPACVTAEGHPIVMAHAEYTVRDANAVADLLSETAEFNNAGPAEDDPEALHFNWLLRGRSRVPENSSPPKKSLMFKSEWTPGPGEPTFLSLGDLMLWENRLELQCLSRERLEAGKQLLSEILTGLIRHRRDKIRPFELETEEPASQLASARRSSIPRAERLAFEREMLDRHTTEWLDKPVAGWDNLSPRQVVATPEGKAKVKEVLKRMEYLNDSHREAGEPPTMDLDRIRRELGL